MESRIHAIEEFLQNSTFPALKKYEETIARAVVRAREVARKSREPTPNPTPRPPPINEERSEATGPPGVPAPALPEVVELAHARDVPVIVDAAGQLPPASNLHRFIDEGADLVAFSGGKAIRGPQSSGILCGRRDLISAVALQHLDQDVLSELWAPPPSLIDRSQLPGAPQHGIGRPCKVGKEEIVGLLTALELFVQEDPDQRWRDWTQMLEALKDAAGELGNAEWGLVADRKRSDVPTLQLELDEEGAGIKALDLVLQLQQGDPAIYADASLRSEGLVAFRPMCLRRGDPEAIAARLRQLLG